MQSSHLSSSTSLISSYVTLYTGQKASYRIAHHELVHGFRPRAHSSAQRRGRQPFVGSRGRQEIQIHSSLFLQKVRLQRRWCHRQGRAKTLAGRSERNESTMVSLLLSPSTFTILQKRILGSRTDNCFEQIS